MNWYYARGDERMGPVDDDELAHLVDSGIINGQTLVWNEDMTDWQTYASVAPSVVPSFASDEAPTEVPASLYGTQSTQACAECGRHFMHDEMVSYQDQWVCGDCKEAFFQRVREGGTFAGALNYGGFWIRLVARVIDGFILGFVGLLQSMVQAMVTGQSAFEPNYGPSGADIAILLISMGISTFIALAYEVYFLGKYGATPGKMAFGLKVVMSDGQPISYGRAVGRFFATYLSGITLYIGYIIAAFDEQKRTLHDHICDTRVVRK